MVKPNRINIVLLERCHHPLVGSFPDGHALDEPLDTGQVLMLRTAVDRLLRHVSDGERELLASMSAGRDHLVPTVMTAGSARELSGIISHLWDRAPEAEREPLGEWFSCFNRSPARRIAAPPVPSDEHEGSAPSI